jgi:hypothetical protein
MRAKELYLHLAEACEHIADVTDLPNNKKAGMLASAAVWRRLAGAFSPSVEARSNVLADRITGIGD